MDFKFKNEMKIRCLSILLISILAFTMPSCHIIDALDGTKTDLSSITLETYGIVYSYDRYSYAVEFRARLKGNTSKDFPQTIEAVFVLEGDPIFVEMTVDQASDTEYEYSGMDEYSHFGTRPSKWSTYTVKSTVLGKTISRSGEFNGLWTNSEL